MSKKRQLQYDLGPEGNFAPCGRCGSKDSQLYQADLDRVCYECFTSERERLERWHRHKALAEKEPQA